MEARTSPDLDRWSAVAQHRTVTVGDLTVSYLPDGFVQLHPETWFSLPGDRGDYFGMPELISGSGYLTGSIGSLLVSGPGVAVMIDAGFGPRHLPAARSHPSLGDMNGGGLAEAGLLPDRLDAAVFTHLHDDHTGWLNHDGGPGRLLRDTALHASTAELGQNGLGHDPRWRAISDGTVIVPGITALASPGHTAGHTSYLIESNGQRLLCFGDVMHSPVQVSQPHLSSCFEADPIASLESRRRTLELLSGADVIGAGLHFGDVVFGKVRPGDDGGLRWVPLP
ncbi:MBL fold metallo-hydrolase [Paenarthrobacter sp. NPDC089714]|uniref:MBL fold metallo-hydrolase n=1 Tax=Paenarthrobacter sp. NPDC089714 TaxID=3364377 RepID=UPI00382AFF03